MSLAAIGGRARKSQSGPYEVTRHVQTSVQNLLWGVAAGRCQFAGCNRPVWKSPVTQEVVNIAEKAHIYSFRPDGARGNVGVDPKLLNNLDNLLLVCHDCHKKIDNEKDGGRYTVPLLRAMKAAHEERIEIAASVAPEMSTHILFYGANIGDQAAPLNWTQAATALFPKRYPAPGRGIELGFANSAYQDRDPGFWAREASNLRSLFSRKVADELSLGRLNHLSVFALAPQPLLILLGTLLTDIPPVDVFQLHREPDSSWSWPEGGISQKLLVTRPATTSGPPALLLSLSATVTDDRIQSVLGPDVAIWRISIPSPHNDFTKSSAFLGEFRSEVRKLLDDIKLVHGQKTLIHIFPAASNSICVELGRVRMPKADAPWRVYDQVNACGGFIPALNIPEGGDHESR